MTTVSEVKVDLKPFLQIIVKIPGAVSLVRPGN